MGDQIEEAMMAQYITEKLKGLNTQTHVRLGQPRGYTKQNPAPEYTRRLFMSTLPEADLIELTGHGATIYEFAIWRPQAKLGQLLVYAELLPATPTFYDLTPDDIRLVLVNGQEDSTIRAIAKKYGVDYVLYLPPELAAMVAGRRGGQ